MAPLSGVEHFSNCSIAGFAEGFLVFFWPLTAYPLIFFKGSDEVGLFFLFDPQIFSFFPGRWFEILFSLVPGQGFCFFLVPWILVDIRLVNIYIYIYIYICVCVCVCVCVSVEYINICMYVSCVIYLYTSMCVYNICMCLYV